MASELLGVGYIIGFRTSAIMMAGAVLGSLVIAPTIYMFGDGMTVLLPPGDEGHQGHDHQGDIRKNYVLLHWRRLRSRGRHHQHDSNVADDRPLDRLRSGQSAAGVLAEATAGRIGPTMTSHLGSSWSAAYWCCWEYLVYFLLPEVEFDWRHALGRALLLLFGFLFVTVSSRLTGEIGSSSNPISGMTVATLLLTCLIFLALGMDHLGATPCWRSLSAAWCASRRPTAARLRKTSRPATSSAVRRACSSMPSSLGTLTSALVIGFTLLLFNASGTIYSTTTCQTARVQAVHRGVDSDGNRKPPKGDETLSRLARGTRGRGKSLTRVPKNTKYLVDDSGRICYYVDPAITGKITQRETYADIESFGVNRRPHRWR